MDGMDFVFMLTRADQTVGDCLRVIEEIHPVGLRHIGFKDVGVPPAVLRELVAAIRAQGATSYMEVVSTTTEACLTSARVAKDLGVDRLLGGTQVDEVMAILAGSLHHLPSVPRQAERPPDPARRQRRGRRGRLPAVRGQGLRRRRSAGVSRHRGRADRARARRPPRHAGLPARRR